MSAIDFMAEALAIKDEIIALRRKIHQYPEIGGTETETQRLVVDYLEALGVKTQKIADTGVLGLLEGSKPGGAVGLRADMDALKIQEQTGVPYASVRPGIMHACGHDCHTATLLGAARILAAHRENLPGNVKFFFQPDEEGDGGAERMIAAGGLENPKVTAMFGAHVNPGLPVGSIGVRPGKSYAASNPFEITIKGFGSHGAAPHLGVDAIAVACQVVSALQLCISRETDPVDSAIITVGTIQGGTQRNSIAEEVKMSGIIRTLGPATRQKIVAAARRVAEGTAHALGAQAEIVIHESYPGVVNDPAMTELARESIAELLGEDKVVPISVPNMGTEDFGIFLEHVPGSFYQAGVANPAKTPTVSLHSGQFNVDEDALPVMSAVHAKVAWDYLKGVSR
ncbi:MAG: amidohydrolase [Peptococcaceae bacterium]|nr:amidohydrolase [Peptococcaceae bacterium]